MMADASEIREYLTARGYAPPGASTWDLLEVLNDVAGRECARLEAELATRDWQIERLTELLVGLGCGKAEFDWLLTAKRKGPNK